MGTRLRGLAYALRDDELLFGLIAVNIALKNPSVPRFRTESVSFRAFIHLNDQAGNPPGAGLRIETGKSHQYAHQETS